MATAGALRRVVLPTQLCRVPPSFAPSRPEQPRERRIRVEDSAAPTFVVTNSVIVRCLGARESPFHTSSRSRRWTLASADPAPDPLHPLPLHGRGRRQRLGDDAIVGVGHDRPRRAPAAGAGTPAGTAPRWSRTIGIGANGANVWSVTAASHSAFGSAPAANRSRWSGCRTGDPFLHQLAALRIDGDVVLALSVGLALTDALVVLEAPERLERHLADDGGAGVGKEGDGTTGSRKLAHTGRRGRVRDGPTRRVREELAGRLLEPLAERLATGHARRRLLGKNPRSSSWLRAASCRSSSVVGTWSNDGRASMSTMRCSSFSRNCGRSFRRAVPSLADCTRCSRVAGSVSMTG